METVRKIDFFGGLHGNYLELVVNCFIDQNKSYDISLPQFNSNGACHLKNKNKSYVPITKSGHFSSGSIQQPFGNDDLVIRIVPTEHDLLIAITNSFLRAGDQTLDLHHLQQDTYKKMSGLPKLRSFLQTLISNHGLQQEYPRKILRKYFYAMFDEYKHGLGMFNNWLPANKVHNFDFRNFFSFSDFFLALQKISQFVNMEFIPTPQLIVLHQNFLDLNQGLASETKCNKIIESIVCQESKKLQLNILEEAWINYKISKMFNLYEVPELETDNYPSDTKIISDICYFKDQRA